jgi:hypothetical protein
MNGYNFTENVRKALARAREEATRLHHEYVGTEHILLALTAEKDTVAAAVLRSLSVDLSQIRQKLEKTVKLGRGATGPELPYTSRAKKVLELAMSEARDSKYNFVGTEHLLLGLLREQKGIAAQVLTDVGITLDRARAEILRTPRVVSRAGFVSTATPEMGVVSPPLSSNPAFRIFWTTLGLVVLIESVPPMLHLLRKSGDADPHVAWLASVEAVGSALFLFPRTMRYGAWILLAVFAIAIVAHLAKGEFPAPLLVYAAGTLFVLIHGAPSVGRRRRTAAAWWNRGTPPHEKM